MSDEHDLQEVPIDSGGERLQESAGTDVMAGLSGAGGLAGLGSLYYTRAQYLLVRDGRDAERAALEAQYEADRRALDTEYRVLYARRYGLDALDRFDGFGVDDDYFDGFGVE